jgi:hypothetical protein
MSEAVLRIARAKKTLNEASYAGNIGIMELVKFYQKATPSMVTDLKRLIAQKKDREAWKMVQDVTGVKLHKSVNEAKNIKSDILPVSGAGQDGTDEVRKNYQSATPGQPVKSFTDYIKDK